MLRPLVIAALVLSLMWQLVALAWPGGVAAVLDGGEHAALHWAGEGHHHRDDGSHHVDESDESASHMALDHSGVVGLPPSAGGDTLSLPALARAEHHARTGPHPFLDGPLRPPRLTA